MSIFDETGQGASVTEGYRALELFTNRYSYLRKFATYLNEDPPPEKILFVHGDGGNGKSLLLRFLVEQCCKEFAPDDWTYLKGMEDAEFASQLRDADVTPVPHVLHDFAMQPNLDERPQEPFDGPLMLRRALANRGLLFPLFDFACVWRMYKTGQLSSNTLRMRYPSEEAGVITALVGVVQSVPVLNLASSVLSLFTKRHGNRLTVWRRGRKIDEDELKAIQRMNPGSDLLDALPALLAKDLTASLSLPEAPRRLVLAFDTHEAFWGGSKNLSTNERQRDEWFRTFLGNLDFRAGIVVLVAGRELPRWSDLPASRIPDDYLEPWPVRHFSEPDALVYLHKAGIADAALQRKLLAFAAVAPGEIHPFYLGLCVDVAQTAERKGEPLDRGEFEHVPAVELRTQELIERLLRYADDDAMLAVHALSACRGFDSRIYFALADTLRFTATNAAFEALIRFSFVWRSPAGGSRSFRIHDLLRRLFYEGKDPVTLQAHHILEQHYRGASLRDRLAIAEALYHWNRQHPAEGCAGWIAAFDGSLKNSDVPLADALFEVATDLVVPDVALQAAIKRRAGDLFADRNRNEDARSAYREALDLYKAARSGETADLAVGQGDTFWRLADAEVSLSWYDDALASYQHSIEAYQRALSVEPNRPDALVGKGVALWSLGWLYATLSRLPDAKAAADAAIKSLEKALPLAPNTVEAHVEMASALRLVGELQCKVTPALAGTSFKQALEELAGALKLAPGFLVAQRRKANLLVAAGALDAFLSRHESAAEAYHQAIACCEDALRRAPYSWRTQNQWGAALHLLADLNASRSDTADAIENYGRAIAFYDETLRQAPNFLSGQCNKAIALVRLAGVHLDCGRFEEALAYYEQAIALSDEALRRAPNGVYALATKGSALKAAADLHLTAGRREASLASYETALRCCNAVLDFVPTAGAHIDKGTALKGLGDWHADTLNTGEAVTHYSQAVASFDQALQIEAGNTIAYFWKGLALQAAADSWKAAAKPDEARRTCTESLGAFDETLRLNPQDLFSLAQKGATLWRLADLYAELSENTEALAHYEKVIELSDDMLRIAPNHRTAWENKGIALARRGDAESEADDFEKALAHHREALRCFDQALKTVPGNMDLRINRARAEAKQAGVLASLSRHGEAISGYHSALQTFMEAVRVRRDCVPWLNSLGATWEQLAGVHQDLLEREQALAGCASALEAYEQALRRAPRVRSAANNRANLLRTIGDLRAGLCQQEGAFAAYDQSIAAFRDLLGTAPGEIDTVFRLGLGVASAASLSARLGRPTATAGLTEAIDLFDQVLRNAPTFRHAALNRGICCRRIGNLQRASGLRQESVASYGQALQFLQKELDRFPEELLGNFMKGFTFLDKANLLSELEGHESAGESYSQAIKSFLDVLRWLPDHPGNLTDKGICLEKIADALASLGDLQGALVKYQEALVSLNEACQRFPREFDTLLETGTTLAGLGKVQSQTLCLAAARESHQHAMALLVAAEQLCPEDIELKNAKRTVGRLISEAANSQ
jgi:tetratricopeptide (TPR) repeat protein